MRRSPARVGAPAAALAVLLLAAGCASPGPGAHDRNTLRGTATYLQRSALPPDAVLHVRIEDISRADAPSTLIAGTTVPTAGRQPPIPFALEFDRDALQARGRYSVRAELRAPGRLLFTTTRVYPVPEPGAALDLVLEPVSSPDVPPGGPATTTPLTDTYWKLVELDGRPAMVASGSREPHLVLRAGDAQVTGSTGVNQLAGTYSTDGSRLSFGGTATTRRAGPPDQMAQESRFLGVLAETTEFAITARTLELRAGERILARFEAAAPR